MSNLLMKSKGAVDRNSLDKITISCHRAFTSANILSINVVNSNHPIPSNNSSIHEPMAPRPSVPSSPNASTQNRTPSYTDLPVPTLNKVIQKGQKIPLFDQQNFCSLKAYIGWNVSSSACDIDLSAFLLGENEKVLGDDWFIFYGQHESPDHSTYFYEHEKNCREAITINFKAINPAVKKIVFVLTIHEAIQRKLNFSMVRDAYIKLVDATTQLELASFKLTDYYANVTSMMIGEIYRHQHMWKFNAIGNGVAKDLAGLCAIYGVQIDD